MELLRKKKTTNSLALSKENLIAQKNHFPNSSGNKSTKKTMYLLMSKSFKTEMTRVFQSSQYSMRGIGSS